MLTSLYSAGWPIARVLQGFRIYGLHGRNLTQPGLVFALGRSSMQPVVLRLVLVCGLVAASVTTRAQTTPPAQTTDLDAFMSRVLERRDDNWKKLQQYVLEERQTVDFIGPGATPLYRSRIESTWFPRDGMFIKSPLRINGMTVKEDDRRRFEAEWLKLEERREKRRAEREKAERPENDSASTTPLTEEGVRQALEPGFVSAAYFLRFKFDPGHYALAGRERVEGRDTLKIEYYPSQLFREGRTRPNKELRKRSAEIETKMNKSAQVTLWVDPVERQILKYDFANVDLEFLPGRFMVRIDGMNAAMEMGEPFPSVWLPRSIRIGFDLSTALGPIDGRYAVDYYDYKLATVDTKVR
jgi:hypothetical protein